MNIQQQVRILWKREEIAPLLFHNIFNISLTSRVQLHIYLLNVVVRIIFSSILQILVEVWISRRFNRVPWNLRLRESTVFRFKAIRFYYQNSYEGNRLEHKFSQNHLPSFQNYDTSMAITIYIYLHTTNNGAPTVRTLTINKLKMFTFVVIHYQYKCV